MRPRVLRTLRRLAGAARTLRQSVDVGDALRQILLDGSRVPLYRAAAFGVPGAVPASAAGAALEDARVLRTQVQTVYTRCAERTADAVAAGATAAGDIDERVEREQARLEALFGDSFLVAPAFEPANAAEVTQAFSATRRATLLADARPLAVETWIGRTARVRDRIGTYQDLGLRLESPPRM
ncbi:hypothetical protein [Halobellus marinus]|uniref:hypothetical protein n=1 Tax=Halobellus marinus TaxID=3075123 RepID=UPI0028AE5760|nr:hypothetical protein [Halobellus sp. DFY28]